MAITAQQKANLLGVTSFMFNFAPDQASYARFEARIEASTLWVLTWPVPKRTPASLLKAQPALKKST